MKKYILSFLIIAAIPLLSKAQNCTNESLLQKSGAWNESSGDSSGIAAADLAREKKVVAAIHTMIKSKYTPVGVNARFNAGSNVSFIK